MNKKLAIFAFSLFIMNNQLIEKRNQIIEEDQEIYSLTNISYEYFDIVVTDKSKKEKIYKKLQPGITIKSLDYYGNLEKEHKILFIVEEFENFIYIQFEEEHMFNKYIPYTLSLDDLTIKPTTLEPNIVIINF